MIMNNFEWLSTLDLSVDSTLFRTALCPDKDLVAIAVNGCPVKLLLYKIQGSKRWEVEVAGVGTESPQKIVALTWSPDGILKIPVYDCFQRFITLFSARKVRALSLLNTPHG
jgi:hypothetical protein